MNYVFYNTLTESFGRETVQPYTMDGKPGPLPEGTVELQIVREEPPADIPEGFVATPSKTVNLEARQLVYSFEVAASPVPATLTKLQFVGQLINEGLLAQSSTFINGSGIPEGPQREHAKAQWLWGNEVPRNGPVVIALLAHLGKDSDAIDTFFRNASKL